jgi:hypothetical protein
MKDPHSRTQVCLALVAAAALAVPTVAQALDLRGSLGEAGFTHYVSPVSSPIFNETPYITTEVRPMWLHQDIPSQFATDGGDIDVLAVQIRVALTDRLGFIATKDGWADIDFDQAVPDESGAVNVAFGFKYAAVALPESNTLVTLGVKYEAPSGGIRTANIKLQGQGAGMIDVFAAAARTFDRIGVEANLGAQIAMDGDDDTSFLHYSLHVDYDVMGRVFPLIEFNGYTPIEDGSRTAFGANGMDLVNLGARNADTVITFAPGVRVRLMDNVDFGFAFEMPLTDDEDLMDWRVTNDFVIHL